MFLFRFICWIRGQCCFQSKPHKACGIDANGDYWEDDQHVVKYIQCRTCGMINPEWLEKIVLK